MTRVLTIPAVELRRFFADRSNLFFVFIFPLAMVAVIGWQFGGGESRSGAVAVHADESPLRTALVDGWQDADLEVTLLDDADEVRTQVAAGDVEVGVLVPAAAASAYDAGDPLGLEIVQGTSSSSPAVAEVVRAQAETVAVEAAQVALVSRFADRAEAQDALQAATRDLPGPRLLVQEPDDPVAQAFAGAGRFGTGATAQLLLFVFLSSLSASATLIKARRDGVIRRTLSAPVTRLEVVTGLAAGRVAIALAQGGYIIVASSLLFGVDWGNLWSTLLVLLVFAVVAAGAAIIIGVLVDAEGAASGLSVGAGLVIGAIGGCMVPLELYPDRLRAVAHLTPHAWAYDALADIQRRGAGVLDVLPELGVLLAMAIAMLGVAGLLLRRSLARAM
ncbi:ABC-2 [Serinicoccus hydrothermalis]|uniref:ABC-2 n=1 Tax=Serinicoccus hydrothermalis TaxID=1758689 RepID=A0A1B1NCN9_9MICO|nr:ABC transporter permease [Serinicoccus hydrothermalis]ANS79186.1 ABC-2 [Serinicoccus hydrothermalis]